MILKTKILIIIFLCSVFIANASEITPIYPIMMEKRLSERAWDKIAFCKWRIPCYWQKQIGSTLTPITGSTLISALDTILTDNFNALNLDKMEISTTTLPFVTTLVNLETIGTIGTGVWQGTPIGVAYNGTGTTSPLQYFVMLGNGSAGLVGASTTGTSGQFLTSNGAGAYPNWQSSTVNQGDPYLWTGVHNFTGTTLIKNLNASSTAANPMVWNGVSYDTPDAEGASSTVLMTDGGGGLTWNTLDWRLLAATTTAGAMSFATTTFDGVSDLKVVMGFELGSNTGQIQMTFNGDYGTNYGWTFEMDDVLPASAPNTNQRFMAIQQSSTTPMFLTFFIRNDASKRKLLDWRGTFNPSGAGIPVIIEGAAVWNNTSNQITSIGITKASGGTFAAGTVFRVYGR